MKLLIRIFLLVCFLLSMGYRHLNAHSYQEDVFFASVKHPGKSEHLSLRPLHECQVATLLTAPPGDGEKGHRIEATANENKEEDENEEEDEDNERSSSRYSGNDNYFTTLLYSTASAFFYDSTTKYLSCCKHLSHLSSYRYIIFRVIRI